MFKSIRHCIFNVLKQFSKTELTQISEDSILIEQPSDFAYGDLYTNAAMVFSKRLSVVPRILATSIKEALLHNEYVKEVSIAGPGFINFKLNNEAWLGIITEIIQKDKKYSYTDLFNQALINVEFVSANPTGPLHTGHARNAVFGSVLSNLLEKVGYRVTKEFYINDQGNQIKFLAKSLYLRYREALGIQISESDFSKDMYCGDYLKDLAQELVTLYQDQFLNKPEEDWIGFFKKFAVDRMMENVKTDLKLLGITMDCYTHESDICERKLVEEALDILYEHGDIYEGILPRPKGFSEDDEWEERPQLLFKSTKYGDDVDRAIKKSDGSWTYFAGDLAYHLDKIRRGYNKMIAVLGADHNGYVKRLKSAVSALSNGKAEIEIRLYQLVNFLENGKVIKMSKRSGNFITLKDVVARVGKDVTRYMMISRHQDVMIDFDFVKAIEQSMDNPLFYIQYAYARICSVFRNFVSNFGEINKDELIACDKSILTDESELLLIKHLAMWPEVVKNSAIAIEPHRLLVYLQKTAALFHSLWNKGKMNTELRFVDVNNKMDTIARISLLQAVKTVIEDGFEIVGITPMTEMK